MFTADFKRAVLIALVSLASVILGAGTAISSPLDLSDLTPRWIEVRFEVSPHHAPGRLDQEWSRPRRAFLEPDLANQRVRIRIPGDELEAQLRSAGADPIGGSFSEFVWTFDPATGHVLDAQMTGNLREDFAIGLIRSSTIVEIRVELTTIATAGFRPVHRILGQQTHPFCAALNSDRNCTIVEPRRFDPGRGYVNAVGSLRAVTSLATIQTFSPLGEVVFSESNKNLNESVASGRSSHDEVCSPPINGSCRPDLRGESS